MPKSIEEILGRGPVQKERPIPGTLLGEADMVRYVSFYSKELPAKIFRNVTRKVNPPLVTGGGVVLEGCIITLPDTTSMYPLIFHGDVAGWQRQIEEGAHALGLGIVDKA
ncbi:hypothetical protein TPR58_15145 [Sphingomonas sp. HF-S3]|uniref:Uncharacterized protein n=1 Tax=Sphingomonas rustica TaxID=3103142 RepID=A0ABV0BEL0_9SPHN